MSEAKRRLTQRNYAVAAALLALVALFFVITVVKIRQSVELGEAMRHQPANAVAAPTPASTVTP